MSEVPDMLSVRDVAQKLRRGPKYVRELIHHGKLKAVRLKKPSGRYLVFPGKRFVAAIIDAVITVVVGFIPLVGGLAATAYWLVRDGMELDFMDRRSIKRTANRSQTKRPTRSSVQ